MDEFEQLPLPLWDSGPAEQRVRLRLVDETMLPPDIVTINWGVVNQWKRFTARDRQVLLLVVRGATYAEMRDELKRPIGSIKRSMVHLLDISGTANRGELIGLATSMPADASKDASSVRVVGGH